MRGGDQMRDSTAPLPIMKGKHANGIIAGSGQSLFGPAPGSPSDSLLLVAEPLPLAVLFDDLLEHHRSLQSGGVIFSH